MYVALEEAIFALIISQKENVFSSLLNGIFSVLTTFL